MHPEKGVVLKRIKMGNPQPSSKAEASAMNAVQRLNGSGFSRALLKGPRRLKL